MHIVRTSNTALGTFGQEDLMMPLIEASSGGLSRSEDDLVHLVDNGNSNTTNGSSQAHSVLEALTVTSVAAGLVLGSLICLANMYFGMQAGSVNAMPMQSALISVACSRMCRHYVSKSLSAPEVTIIEIIAGAVGLAPFTSGYIGFIPALEYLVPADQGERLHFTSTQLLSWSIGTCSLGIIVAAPFRNYFILREKLRFPSATATGTLIGMLLGTPNVLYKKYPDSQATVPSRPCRASDPSTSPASGAPGQHDVLDTEQEGTSKGIGRSVTVLSTALSGSLVFVSILLTLASFWTHPSIGCFLLLFSDPAPSTNLWQDCC